MYDPMEFYAILNPQDSLTFCLETLLFVCFAALNDAPGGIINNEQSEKVMIKIHLKNRTSKMPGVQMPIGDPLPFPVPKLSIG